MTQNTKTASHVYDTFETQLYTTWQTTNSTTFCNTLQISTICTQLYNIVHNSSKARQFKTLHSSITYSTLYATFLKQKKTNKHIHIYTTRTQLYNTIHKYIQHYTQPWKPYQHSTRFYNSVHNFTHLFRHVQKLGKALEHYPRRHTTSYCSQLYKTFTKLVNMCTTRTQLLQTVLHNFSKLKTKC